MRPIDADALIEKCGDWYVEEGTESGFIGTLKNLLATEQTIQPEPQWIPVEMELPEDFTDVLVWFEYFRYGDYNCLYQTHGIGTYVANYNLWTVNHETGWKDLRVIAWMPLPEAYKPNK
jgi:hypothetical protein